MKKGLKKCYYGKIGDAISVIMAVAFLGKIELSVVPQTIFTQQYFRYHNVKIHLAGHNLLWWQ